MDNASVEMDTWALEREIDELAKQRDTLLEEMDNNGLRSVTVKPDVEPWPTPPLTPPRSDREGNKALTVEFKTLVQQLTNGAYAKVDPACDQRIAEFISDGWVEHHWADHVVLPEGAKRPEFWRVVTLRREITPPPAPPHSDREGSKEAATDEGATSEPLTGEVVEDGEKETVIEFPALTPQPPLPQGEGEEGPEPAASVPTIGRTPCMASLRSEEETPPLTPPHSDREGNESRYGRVGVNGALYQYQRGKLAGKPLIEPLSPEAHQPVSARVRKGLNEVTFEEAWKSPFGMYTLEEKAVIGNLEAWKSQWPEKNFRINEDSLELEYDDDDVHESAARRARLARPDFPDFAGDDEGGEHTATGYRIPEPAHGDVVRAGEGTAGQGSGAGYQERVG